MARDSVWYRLGYALESARHGLAGAAAASRRLPSAGEIRERLGSSRPGSSPGDGKGAGGSTDAPFGAGTAMELILAGTAGSLMARLLNLWPGRGTPGPLGWIRGAAAGAGATLVAELARPVVGGAGGLPVLDDELADAVLAGAGRGLVFAAVLEPRLPGPAPLRGVAYGALEYAVSPWGGMGEVLGPHNPARKIPGLGPLLAEAERGREASLADHVVFGLALASLYGRTVLRRSRSDEEA